MLCFFGEEQRLPLTADLGMFSEKKKKILYYVNKYFFLNSSYVIIYLGNTSKSQMREENN